MAPTGRGNNNEVVKLVFQASDQASKVVDDIDTQISDLGKAAAKTQTAFSKLGGAINDKFRETLGLVGDTPKVLGAAENIANGVSRAFNSVGAKIAGFVGVLGAAQLLINNGPFQLLIQQNVELQEQLLSTQSSLVATNQVLQNGVAIDDPTQAIKALEGPVNAAINKVRKDSLDLVGVTSRDLISTFNVLTSQIASVGGGLDDAANLTISFSAALGTLGIPLEQSRQEILSILQAQISSDSALAKSIGLTNEQVRLWKQQGTLVENVNKRLEAFKAGNALAAQTIGGISSNIQEIIQEAARLAGEPLVEPIVKELGGFYEFIKANQGAITEGVAEVAQDLLTAGQSIIEIIKAIAESTGGIITSIPKFLSSSLVEIVQTLEVAIKGALTFLEPLFNVLTAFAQNAANLGPLFKFVLVFKSLELAAKSAIPAFKTFIGLVPGLGEALKFINAQGPGSIQAFLGLDQAIDGATGKVNIFAAAKTKLLSITKENGALLLKQVASYGLLAGGVVLAAFAFDQLILKNESVREGLLGIFNAVVSFGQSILQYIQNPVIAITAALVGLVAIIQSGLLPSIVATTTNLLTLAATGLTKAVAAITALQAQMIALARSTVAAAAAFARFAIATVIQQFQRLQAVIALTVAQIKSAGFASFARSIFAIGTAAGSGGAAAGLSALSKAFGTAAGAAKSFILATGPIALITVAVITLAEAWNAYNRIQKASEEATKSLTEALKEQAEARKALAEELAAAQNEESEVGETGAEEARKAVEADIEKERSKLNKFVEGYINLGNKVFGLGLTTAGLSQEEKDAIAKQYDERIKAAKSGFERYRLRVEKFARLGADFTGDEAKAQLEGNAAALGDYGAEADAAATRVQALNGEYASLVDQLNNGQITQEQFNKQSEILDKQYEQEEQSLADNLKMLSELQLAEDADINKRRELVKAIQETQDALAEGRETELAQKRFQDLGTAYSQLGQKVEEAVSYIRGGVGETELLNQKIDDVLKNVPSLLDQGFIDQDSAIDALEAIANNVNATAEQQIAAQQEISKIIQQGGEKRVQEVQREQQAIQRKRAEGNLTDLEAEIQLTELKQKEYDTRLEALQENTRKSLELLQEQEKASIDSINSTISDIQEQISAVENDPELGDKERAEALAQLNQQEQSLLDKRADTQAAFNARQEKINRDAAKEQETIANEAAESAAQAEKAIYDARIAELDRANQKLLDATQAAENERLTEIAKLRAQGTTEIEDAQIGIKELEARKAVIKDELAVEQARLAALEALDPLSDPEEEEARQAQIRQSRLKTQDLVKQGYELESQLLEAQIQLIEQKLAEANRQIANDTEARTQELERQNQLIESLERSLESQAQLLQARADFAQTSVDALTGQLDILAEGENSEYRRQQIAQTTAAIKLQALQVQQEYELRSLELEQAQLEIAKQRELAENRIAQAKAESELAIGQNEVQLAQEKFSRGEITESELRGVELQQQRRQLELQGLREQRQLIEDDLTVQRQVFGLRRQGLELQQNLQTRQAQSELAAALPPGLRQRAQANLRDQIAQDFGFADSRQLRESGTALARQVASDNFQGLPATVGPQSAFDPELEGLSNVAGGSAFAAAQQQSGREFRSQFGQFAVGPGLPTPTATPFQLPQELRGADLSAFQFAGGQQALPERRQAVEGAQSQRDEQLQELRALREAFQRQQGGGFTAEITVNADQKDLANQIGQGVRSQLEQVFSEAQRQATAAR